MSWVELGKLVQLVQVGGVGVSWVNLFSWGWLVELGEFVKLG